ncbi:MAG: hypothetical protein AAFR51_13650 [Pseudomonadota bacterium]
MTSAREFKQLSVGEQIFQFDMMIYRGELHDKRPLVILNSIEFPVPPSTAFCEMMWAHDIQVIFIRRAGYGASSPLPDALIRAQAIKEGATAAAEAAILRQLLAKMRLENIILLPMGSANPVAFRLIHMAPEIELSILSNPIFNQDVMQVFRPDWFQSMLRQLITSRSGLHVAAQGMKLLVRRDSVSFYKQIFQGHPEDIAYVDANPDDYKDAGKYLLDTDPSLLYYDALMCLLPDPLLKDTYFDGRDVMVMVGEHSGAYWKDQMQQEADRLGLPMVYAPNGDLFSGYASPRTVIEIIEQNKNSIQQMT